MKILIKVSFAIILLTVIVLSSCNNGISPTDEIIYKSKLVDCTTDEPLVGVEIILSTWTFGQTIFNESRRTVTDENGEFQFVVNELNLNNHHYYIGIESYGYIDSDSIMKVRFDGLVLINGKEYIYASQSNNGNLAINPTNNEGSFKLCPSGYYKINIKNINPYDDRDSIKMYTYENGRLDLVGTDVDVTIIESTQKYIRRTFYWYYWKNGQRFHDEAEYNCPFGDTCLVNIHY